jgi:hypothetical protein
MVLCRIKYSKPEPVQFFKELDSKNRVINYWRTPTNFHFEIKGGIPQLSLGLAKRFAGMLVGQIRKYGQYKLQRWC